MKAIIMAGGEGTRLRPMTCRRPKPMVDFFGKPVVHHIVELLKRNGITDICMTLGYMPEVVMDRFGDGASMGVSIRYSVEREPMGTAGGVRACADFAGDDDVIVISGDAVCDADLDRCVRFHKARGADVTIVLSRQTQVLEYGLVVTDGEGKIKSFIEKPTWDGVVTDMVNTGIYILTPAALRAIPAGKRLDFGRDIFPSMLASGAKLYGIYPGGYWCDVGSPGAYLECCRHVLEGRVGLKTEAPEIKKGIYSAAALPENVRLVPPVYIGGECTIAPGAKVGPFAVLTGSTTVGEGAEISGSVLTSARVRSGARVTGSILCQGVSVGTEAVIMGGSVLGDGCVVGDGACVAADGRMWPGVSARRGECVIGEVRSDDASRAVSMGPGGTVTGNMFFTVTPETALHIGEIMADLGRVGISCDGSPAALTAAQAAGCGVCSGGGTAVTLDAGFEREASFAVNEFGLDACLFVSREGDDLRVALFGREGGGLDSAYHRKLNSALSGRAGRIPSAITGGMTMITGSQDAYIAFAVNQSGGEGAGGGLCAAVTGAGAAARRLKTVLTRLGCTVEDGTAGIPVFTADAYGNVTAVSEDEMPVDAPHLLAAAVWCAAESGERAIAVPDDIPDRVVAAAERYGAALMTDVPPGKSRPDLRHGIFCAAYIAGFMARRGMKLSEIMRELPAFAFAGERVEINVGRAAAMRRLADAYAAETAGEIGAPLVFRTDGGVVKVVPAWDGEALQITAEGTDDKAAGRLADSFRRRALQL